MVGLFVVIGGFHVGSFAPQAEAAAGINQQINFQARLLNSQGATVPDGTYNVQFKIYQDGTGCVVSGSSPCGGTLLWTESWLNNTTQGVAVKNGYFSAYLGSISSLAGVDFNQDSLWLSLNIGTTNPSCTPFTNCGGDGEMLPFKRFASNPYALNSGKLSGLTSSQFVQLAQGVQVDTSTASSIFINKTGATGNIIQLQDAGTDAFVVGNAGNTSINTNSATALTVQNGSNNAFGVDTSNIKVAIGLSTASASSRLSVAGQGAANGITLGDGATGSANLYVSANDTLKTDDAFHIDTDVALAFRLRDAAGTTTILTVDNSTGNMSIGATDTSTYRLKVVSATNTGIQVINTASPSATSGAGIVGHLSSLPTAANQRMGYYLFGTTTANSAGLLGYSEQAHSAANKGTYLSFETTNLDTNTRGEKLRISANGNVGIGTTGTPSALLQLGSDAGTAASGIMLGSGADLVTLYRSAGDTLKTDDSLVVGTGLTVSGGGTSITGNSTISGILGGVTDFTLSGSISGGTSYSGSANITSTGGSIIAATHTGPGAVTVSSGGSSALTLTSASGTAILGGTTNSIQRTNSALELDVVNAAAASTLNVTNSDGSQVANLNVEGGLNIGSGQTYKINNADINSAGTLTNVAYENQANVFTAAQSLQHTNASAFLIQTNSGGATLLTADTSAMIIKIGTASAGTLLGVDLTVSEAEVTTTLRVGTTSNGMDFSASGVTYYGTGANLSRRLVLSPEYPGGTLSPDTTSNVGTMTSDSERATANNWRNYYNWVSTQATNQDYDILVRVILPADFVSWETGSCPGSACALEIEYKTGLAATTNNGVSGFIYNASSDTAICALAEAGSTSWTSFGCTSATLDDGGTDLDTAGQVAVIRITLKANSTASAAARAGDIVLRYKAKY